MTRILLTGVSGVGKSAVISALESRGHCAVDLDTPEYSEWVDAEVYATAPGTPVRPDRDWVWREDKVRELLARELYRPLFASGCAANMGQFLPQFDYVVLLSAPEAVVVERLRRRPADEYGSRPDEIARVRDLVGEVEPLLRRVAGHELDTSLPLDQVVESVLALAGR